MRRQRRPHRRPLLSWSREGRLRLSAWCGACWPTSWSCAHSATSSARTRQSETIALPNASPRRCSARSADLELLADGQVAPLPGRHRALRAFADRDAADAQSPYRYDVQSDLRAHVAQLPVAHVLDGKAQARFVLPADLARRQLATAVGEAVVESAQAVGLHL